jgi:hypothetical protein
MKENERETAATQLGRIDEILASEDRLVPSSGFLAAVMGRVEDEATTPVPIPFPWRRALPGFVLAVVVFACVGVGFVRMAGWPVKEALIAPQFAQPTAQAEWIGLGLALTLASGLVARKLVGRP